MALIVRAANIDDMWRLSGSLLASLHASVSAFSVAHALRMSGSFVPVVFHVTAYICCKLAPSPSFRNAAVSSMLMCRIARSWVFFRCGLELMQMSETSRSSYLRGSGLVVETIFCSLEQVYLLLLPAPAGDLLLALHLLGVYSALKSQLLLPPAWLLIAWCCITAVIPHVFLTYLQQITGAHTAPMQTAARPGQPVQQQHQQQQRATLQPSTEAHRDPTAAQQASDASAPATRAGGSRRRHAATGQEEPVRGAGRQGSSSIRRSRQGVQRHHQQGQVEAQDQDQATGRPCPTVHGSSTTLSPPPLPPVYANGRQQQPPVETPAAAPTPQEPSTPLYSLLSTGDSAASTLPGDRRRLGSLLSAPTSLMHDHPSPLHLAMLGTIGTSHNMALAPLSAAEALRSAPSLSTPLPRMPARAARQPSLMQARQLSEALGAPLPRHLKALTSVQQLVSQAAGSYQSRVRTSQVHIKLTAAEPEDLPGDVVGRVEAFLQGSSQHVGWSVKGACVRKGCIAITVDLWKVDPGNPPDEEDQSGAQPGPTISGSQGPEATTSGAAALSGEPQGSGVMEGGVAGGSGGVRGPPESGPSPALGVQGIEDLLAALLPSQTSCFPADGAVAHVAVGRQQLTAIWQSGGGSGGVGAWQVQRGGSQAGQEESGAAPQLSLALLHVDNPVARLPAAIASETTGSGQPAADMQGQLSSSSPHVAPAASSASEITASSIASALSSFSSRSATHQVALLLRLRPSDASLMFAGHDGASAAAQQQQLGGDEAGSAPSRTVEVVARGPWGTCLPVAVVDAEMSAPMGTQHAQETEALLLDSSASSMEALAGDSSSSCVLVALTLDVDLATAPGPGAVQLELWHGLNILASAPLLLLPHLLPDHHQIDPLLEELTHHVSQHSWGEAAATEQLQGPLGALSSSSSSSSSGLPALLSDLGQVLYCAACITSQGGPGDTGSSSPAAAASGPGSWGGVAVSLAERSASDPTYLRGTLMLAQGLQEYVARDDSLPHTAALLEALRTAISSRLSEVVQVTGPSLNQASIDMPTVQLTAPQQLLEDGCGRHSQSTAAAPAEGSTLRRRVLFEPPRVVQQGRPGRQGGHIIAQDTWGQCMSAVVRGFQPQSLEAAYASWLVAQVRPVLVLWRGFYLTWVWLAIWRAVTRGGGVPASHLPAHCLTSLPYSISALLLMLGRGQDRWQERLVVIQAAARAALCAGATAGLIVYPSSYSVGYRMGLDLWVDVTLPALADPLRLPSLLATNVLLLIAGAARQTIFCKVGLEWVVRAVGPRLCAVAIGVALDLRRRALFMREQLSAARKTAAPGECQ